MPDYVSRKTRKRNQGFERKTRRGRGERMTLQEQYEKETGLTRPYLSKCSSLEVFEQLYSGWKSKYIYWLENKIKNLESKLDSYGVK